MYAAEYIQNIKKHDRNKLYQSKLIKIAENKQGRKTLLLTFSDHTLGLPKTLSLQALIHEPPLLVRTPRDDQKTPPL